MGRSVMVPTDAIVTAFIQLPDDSVHFDWEEFVENLRDVVRRRYPSFEHADRWAGRECLVIAENEHAGVAIADYCGLVSVSLAGRNPFGRAWACRIGPGFRATIEKAYAGHALRRVATASNGESFYQRVT